MSDTFRDSQSLLVRRWGELGGYWGINRTMAEIHALLFISGEELCTDDVMAQLHISRGNASMNLRGLVDWGLIHRVHKLGDRKEYFRADTDIWHMFETIMRERRRREVEPIMATISRSREMIAGLAPTETARQTNIDSYRGRLDDLENFLNTMGALFELVIAFGADGVKNLVDMLPKADAPAGRTSSTTAPTAATKAAGSSNGDSARTAGKSKRPPTRKATTR